MEIWDAESSKVMQTRNYCRTQKDSAEICRKLQTRNAETTANIAISLIHQTDRLLHGLIERQKRDFLQNGGIREQMSRARREYRSSFGSNMSNGSNGSYKSNGSYGSNGRTMSCPPSGSPGTPGTPITPITPNKSNQTWSDCAAEGVPEAGGEAAARPFGQAAAIAGKFLHVAQEIGEMEVV